MPMIVGIGTLPKLARVEKVTAYPWALDLGSSPLLGLGCMLFDRHENRSL
jgi:hypothetical protein